MLSDDRAMLFRSTVKGSESHKKIDLSGNPILRLYYTSRVRARPPSLSRYTIVHLESALSHVRRQRTVVLDGVHASLR